MLRRKAGALLAKVERDPSPANLEALERWRVENPRQSAALSSGNSILRDSTILSRARLDSAASQSSRPRPRLALAACSLVLILVGTVYVASQPPKPQFEAALLTTRIGEIREVSLSDGSKVTLDTQTSVRVEIGRNRRQAVLDHGRARFTIARRSTPFTIGAATTAVRVDGAVLDVSRDGASPHIDLLAGKAQIARHDKASSERLLIEAPASISTSSGIIHVVPDSRSADWPSGRLNFSSARLADVVAAADRYSTTKIIVGDPSIVDLRVTGVFKSGDPDGLSKSLSAALGLRLERDDQGNLVLKAQSRRP